MCSVIVVVRALQSKDKQMNQKLSVIKLNNVDVQVNVKVFYVSFHSHTDTHTMQYGCWFE